MATVTELRVPAHDIAFETIFKRIPAVECEMEQVYAESLPGVWFHGVSQQAIEDALEADPTVEAYSWVLQENNRWLYDIAFSEEICKLLSIVFEEEGTILELTGSHGMWSLRGRFPARGNISRTYKRFDEHGIPVDIATMYSYDDPTTEFGLTQEQRKTLVTAIEYGYFEIPRGITMEELADKLNVSPQAVSERLRRAYKTLVTQGLRVTSETAAPSDALTPH